MPSAKYVISGFARLKQRAALLIVCMCCVCAVYVQERHHLNREKIMQTSQQGNLIRKQIMLSANNVEKLEAIASDKGTSVAEVVRLAVDSYDPLDKSEEEQLLAELIDVVNSSTVKAEAALSKGLADVESFFREINDGRD